MERRNEPNRVFAQRTGGVRKELKRAATKFESMAQSATHTLLEEPRPVNITIPAVRETIFIAELNTDEAIRETGIVTLVVPDDPVRLCRIRPLENYPGGGDYDVMTRYMSLCKLKWFDSDTIRSHPFEQVCQFFVQFAHPEFYHKQSQELWYLGAIVADCLLDGFLEGDKQVMGGEEARAQASLDL